jgi:DNA-binding protein H-NS
VAALKPFDFSLFSDRQLVDLVCQAYSEILRRREKGQGLEGQRAGLTEIGGPRYRNPANSAETWSGKGKMPAWVKKALASGRELESLAIERDGDR